MSKKYANPVVRDACVGDAILYLTKARDALALAGAPKTLARVRLALSSAKGARRHSQNRASPYYYASREAIK